MLLSRLKFSRINRKRKKEKKKEYREYSYNLFHYMDIFAIFPRDFTLVYNQRKIFPPIPDITITYII